MVQRKKESVRAFTLIELLFVIAFVGILSIVALPVYLNYRREAQIASMSFFTQNANSGLKMAAAKARVSCYRSHFPPLGVLISNDLLAENYCTDSELPNISDRKILDELVTPPINPLTGLNNIVSVNCYDICDCDVGIAGYYYNPMTGQLGYPGVGLCAGRTIAAISSSEESSTSNSNSNSSYNSSNNNSSNNNSSNNSCGPNYSLDNFNNCRDLCTDTLVDFSFCSSMQALSIATCINTGGSSFSVSGTCTGTGLIYVSGPGSGTLTCDGEAITGSLEGAGSYTLSFGNDTGTLTCTLADICPIDPSCVSDGMGAYNCSNPPYACDCNYTQDEFETMCGDVCLNPNTNTLSSSNSYWGNFCNPI